MKAKYQFVKRPGLKSNPDSERLYPVLVVKETVRINDMMERYAHEYSTLSAADVKASLQLVSELLERSLADGYNVELDGIGFFSVAIGSRPSEGDELPEPSEAEDEGEVRMVNAQSICFKRVNFRLCKEMRRRLSARMHFVRAPKSSVQSYTPEERRARLLSYLDRHGFLSSTDYVQFNCCSKYMALKDLKSFMAEGILRAAGPKNNRLYTRA